MATNPRQELHDAIDRLSEDEARRWSDSLRRIGTTSVAPTQRPLAESDVILAEPILPDDESADDMIETVRRWRRDGGLA